MQRRQVANAPCSAAKPAGSRLRNPSVQAVEPASIGFVYGAGGFSLPGERVVLIPLGRCNSPG